MKFRRALSTLCCTGLLSSMVQAAAPSQTDINSALALIQRDSIIVGGWTSEQLRYAAPFNSTAGNVVPKQLSLLGFEAGVEGLVTGTKLDVDGLHSLPTSVVNSRDIDTLSRLPIPAVIGHVKIGLPLGFDAGVRFGGIPSESFNKNSTHIQTKNTIEGIDIRKKIIDEGILKPFGLTVGLNFTHAHGNLNSTTPYSSNGTVNVNGSTYNSSLTANGSNTGSAASSSHSTWDTKSFGVQAILNKQILFLNPYIGAGADRNFGTVSTSITSSGRETLSDNSGHTDFEDFIVTGGENADAHKWDLRALAGIEFSFLPFLKSNIGFEYAGNKNLAGDLGLRFQFR